MLNHTLLPVSEFKARREKLLSQMADNSVLLLSANKELTRSNDTEFPFCQNKNFYYLTGFTEPDALLMLVKAETTKVVLFCREKDPLQEVWHGRRVGEVAAKSQFAVDEAYTLFDIDDEVEAALITAEQLYFSFDDLELNNRIHAWQKAIAAKVKLGVKAPLQHIDCRTFIDEMRLIKSEQELAIMRQANVISSDAHKRAMTFAKAGKYEYQVEAEIIHQCSMHGARHVAYNSIVAGGDNANILHYTDNNDTLNDGDLLLIDAGGELAGYAADITRTFPVNGKFSDEQKALYQLTLDSQNAAIEAIKPGASFAQLNQIVGEILTKGLYELGILTGDLNQLVAENACKQYFIHGLGHWLGLDVHDVGDYQADEKRQQWRKFEPGMVMTIEPGLYIPQDCQDVEEKWRGIGVRIEDNIVVTEHGYENLSVNCPKTIADIEQVMASGHE